METWSYSGSMIKAACDVDAVGLSTVDVDVRDVVRSVFFG